MRLAYCCPVCRVRYPLGSYVCRGGWPDRNRAGEPAATHPPTEMVLIERPRDTPVREPAAIGGLGDTPVLHGRDVEHRVSPDHVKMRPLAPLAPQWSVPYTPAGDHEIHAGDRVRIDVPGRDPITLTVQEVRGDELIFEP